MAPIKRKSYTLAEKLKVLAQHKKTNLSGRKFAASVGISESTLRDWRAQEEKLKLHANSKVVRKIRKLPRKRVGYFPRIDAAVLEWVKYRNSKGLRVKDDLIRSCARQSRDRYLAMEEPSNLNTFKASKLWCHRFKTRNNLTSRRHTTSHKLPINFREQVIDFIKKVHGLCASNMIKRENIINLDQVPRYYECDSRTTITTKGTKEVLLSKVNNNHKRFTFTPFIDASGRILLKHALFSKLKNIPKHHNQSQVSVNATGMWNETILRQFIDESVRASRGIFGLNDSVLVILDSYGVHTKFVRLNEEQYLENNVHFAIIPPGLTGLLQPLDVALNRSFQQFFDNETTEYQASAILNDNNKTQRGNIKMPSVEFLTTWIVNWCNLQSRDKITKAFDLCGLVPVEDFKPENLHTPLREIYNRNLTMEKWLEKYSSTLEVPHLDFGQDWEIFDGKHAFFRALKFTTDSETETKKWLLDLTTKVLNLLENDVLTNPLMTEEDKTIIKDGLNFTYGHLEAYAIAEIFKTRLHLIYVNSQDVPEERFVFGNEFTGVIGLFFKKNPLVVMLPSDYNPDDLLFVEYTEQTREIEEEEEYEDYEVLDEALFDEALSAEDTDSSDEGVERTLAEVTE